MPYKSISDCTATPDERVKARRPFKQRQRADAWPALRNIDQSFYFCWSEPRLALVRSTIWLPLSRCTFFPLDVITEPAAEPLAALFNCKSLSPITPVEPAPKAPCAPAVAPPAVLPTPPTAAPASLFTVPAAEPAVLPTVPP